MSIDLDDAVQTFASECRELLEEMETALLRLEQAPDDSDTVNAVFRAAHTIKGSSGIFGFDEVESFTHAAENLLDRVRSGVVPVSSDLIALLLASRDQMGMLVEAAVAGAELDPAVRARGAELAAQLRERLGARPTAAPESNAKPAAGAASESGPAVGSDSWHISVRFSRDVLRHGLDPLALLNYLAGMGELTGVAMVGELPVLSQMDPELCHFGLEIDLRGDFGRTELDQALEFFREDSQIRMLPPRAQIEAWKRLIAELPEEEARIGEILVRTGALSQDELDAAIAQQLSEAVIIEAQGARRIGEILVDEGRVDPSVVEAAARKQASARGATQAKSLRIDAQKLDRLINLVGELVISGATTQLQAQRIADEGLLESMSSMGRLVEEIRDSALRLRMVQIGESFNRFQRVVRDISAELGKEIVLTINGAETELDKTVVEKIGDPLMHLVRNAMDHGIETPEQRVAAGKPRQATVGLNAYHDSGSIVIEISDDGRGLDADRILAKARERGLVGAVQQLTPAEIARLIFEPGFSTADKVTNLSGRGVGMDVVKRNIEALRGSVEVESQPGEGTVFTIRLPLTLAIIDGFLVGVGSSSYVIPLDMVIECIEVTDEVRSETLNDAHYINLRGEVLPFLRLTDLFEEGGSRARENIVVVQYAGQKAGLVVDELLGEFQTVIKPLGKVFQNLRGVSGATILGSGAVAVILDVPQLIHSAAGRTRPVRAAATLH